jgi:hypothetical protein
MIWEKDGDLWGHYGLTISLKAKELLKIAHLQHEVTSTPQARSGDGMKLLCAMTGCACDRKRF